MNKLPAPSSFPDLRTRFEQPVVKTEAPLGPRTGPAQPLVRCLSPELAGLQGPELQRETVVHAPVLVRSRTEQTTQKKQADGNGDGDAFIPGVRGVTNFRYAGQGQSSGHEGSGGGNDRGGQSGLRRLVQLESVYLATGHEVSTDVPGHMARCAADLPERCAEHARQHGHSAMLPFLRGAMLELLPQFVRDLSDKMERLAERSQNVQSCDAIRPVSEACQVFLDLMRPLYGAYVRGPFLLADAKEILCEAQDLLAAEVGQRAGAHPEFARVMTRTVQPLIAIFIMSCLPRPGSSVGPMRALASTGAWVEELS